MYQAFLDLETALLQKVATQLNCPVPVMSENKLSPWHFELGQNQFEKILQTSVALEIMATIKQQLPDFFAVIKNPKFYEVKFSLRMRCLQTVANIKSDLYFLQAMYVYRTDRPLTSTE
jgi:hypothetical protein